jgi:hypothetical protein
MLPNNPEASYDRLGTPGSDAGQYPQAAAMSVIFEVEVAWGAVDSRSIGIGNISLEGGGRSLPMAPISKVWSLIFGHFEQMEHSRRSLGAMLPTIERRHNDLLTRFAQQDRLIGFSLTIRTSKVSRRTRGMTIICTSKSNHLDDEKTTSPFICCSRYCVWVVPNGSRL